MDDNPGFFLFLVILMIVLIFFVGMVHGLETQQNNSCKILAEQVHAIDYSSNYSSKNTSTCSFSFEEGTWITQEKFFADTFKKEK